MVCIEVADYPAVVVLYCGIVEFVPCWFYYVKCALSIWHVYGDDGYLFGYAQYFECGDEDAALYSIVRCDMYLSRFMSYTSATPPATYLALCLSMPIVLLMSRPFELRYPQSVFVSYTVFGVMSGF